MKMKEVYILRNLYELSKVKVEKTLKIFSRGLHEAYKLVDLWVLLILVQRVDEIDQVLNELFFGVFELILKELECFFGNINIVSSLGSHNRLDLIVINLLNRPQNISS